MTFFIKALFVQTKTEVKEQGRTAVFLGKNILKYNEKLGYN